MRRVASVLMAIGAVVAVLGVLGVALGWRPSALPAELLDVAAFKLAFIAAGGLIAAGAVIGRASRGSTAVPDVPPRPAEDGRHLAPGDIGMAPGPGEKVHEQQERRP